MNYDLSIIVPVYNSKKYLKRCIMSVMSLNVLTLEVILIDDGSSDGSGQLCDDLACNYNNIKTIHKSNGGVVSARNIGVYAAKGEYITFIDADDWIKADFLFKAIERLKNKPEVDIVVGRMIRDLGSGKSKLIFCEEQEEHIFSQEDAKEALFKREYFGWELCGKIYRKVLFDGWKADESIKICEDLDSNWELFNRANKILYIPSDFYYYYWNDSSMTNDFHYLDSKAYLVFERILNSFWEISLYEKEVLTDIYKRHLVNLIRESYFQKKSKEEIELYQEKLRKVCFIGQEECFPNARIMYSGYYDTLHHLDDFKRYISKRFKQIRLKSEKIYYWGTGAVADYVSRIAFQLGFDCDGYVVSGGELKRTYFHGKRVWYLSDKKIEITDSIILLVKEELQKEIYVNLQNQNYHNVFMVNTMGIV